MAREPGVRLDPPELFPDRRPSVARGRGDRGRRPLAEGAIALRDAQLRRRDEPDHLPRHQPASARKDDRDARRASVEGARQRSEERRVRKECVSSFRSWWVLDPKKKNK